jgi:hypothetical protein
MMRWLVVALLLMGCSGSRSNIDGGGGDLGGAGGGGGGGGGAGGGGGGGSSSAGGYAVLFAGITQSGSTVTANFEQFADPTVALVPTDISTIGACKLQSVPTPSFSQPTFHSAGTVTLTGGTQAVALTPTMPSMYGLYTAYSSSTLLWTGGEALTFAAPGAEAPAFSFSVTAPSIVQFTQPQPVAIGTTVTFDRTKDFALAWTGGTGGQVRFLIAAAASNMPGVYQLQLDCRYDATAGSATVPASTLQMLPANAMGYYDLRGCGSKQFAIDNWQFSVNVESIYSTNTSSGATIRTN